jgi:hypothetical protein
MEKRKFTKEEKLKIIKTSEQGVKQTLEKYSVFLRVIMLGKKMETMGEGFLME